MGVMYLFAIYYCLKLILDMFSSYLLLLLNFKTLNKHNLCSKLFKIYLKNIN
jgi:hypothetical protein